MTFSDMGVVDEDPKFGQEHDWEQQIADLQAKLRDSDACAAAMREFVKDYREDTVEDRAQLICDPPREALYDKLLKRIDAALSSTAGVALLERVAELIGALCVLPAGQRP